MISGSGSRLRTIIRTRLGRQYQIHNSKEHITSSYRCGGGGIVVTLRYIIFKKVDMKQIPTDQEMYNINLPKAIEAFCQDHLQELLWQCGRYTPTSQLCFSDFFSFQQPLWKSHQTTAGLIAIGGVLPRSSPSSVSSISPTEAIVVCFSSFLAIAETAIGHQCAYLTRWLCRSINPSETRLFVTTHRKPRRFSNYSSLAVKRFTISAVSPAKHAAK
jgi:hypothetical protein